MASPDEYQHGVANPESVSQFRETVRTYVAIHDELLNSAKQLRDLRKKKGELGEAIIAYMKSNGIDELQMADGKLVRKQAKRTEGVKKEHILGELKKILDAEQAETAINNILLQRSTELKDSLRRTKAKNGSG